METDEHDWIQNKNGAPKKLNEDETQELIDLIQKKYYDGDPPQRYDIIMKARRILFKNGRVDSLSKNWVESFLEQNKEKIKKVKASPMEELRCQVGLKTVIEWFDLLKENRISDIAPGLIINIDETGSGSLCTKNLVRKTVLFQKISIATFFIKFQGKRNIYRLFCLLLLMVQC